MKNYFVSYKNPITACLFIILLGGIFVFSQFKTSLFPEITFPKIKIIADAGLQPVDKMMVTVTKPLENAIKQVPDLLTIRSTTSRGTCEISAFMDWNTNIDLAQQRIESKINEINNSLPTGVQVTVEKMNPSILQVIGYSLESASQKNPIDMKMLALYTIKPFLSQVPGVSEVRISGGKTKEYWIRLNVSKMGTLGITPEVVMTALSQTNFIKSNGYLSDYHMLYLSVTDATVHTLDQLQSVVISNNGKRIIQLKDFADVSVKEAI
jgi:multidrug efflux pump subunit AcrB